MKFPKVKTSDSTLDYILIVLFLIFLVFQIEIPEFLAGWIDTPVGIAVVVIVAFYMFLFTTPILGVLSLVVAYEILRRSARQTGNYAIPKFLPSQEKRDTQLSALNPPQATTLEEEVVAVMAPIGVSGGSTAAAVETVFKPVNEEVHGASAV